MEFQSHSAKGKSCLEYWQELPITTVTMDLRNRATNSHFCRILGNTPNNYQIIIPAPVPIEISATDRDQVEQTHNQTFRIAINKEHYQLYSV
jgi:hypothetical protein